MEFKLNNDIRSISEDGDVYIESDMVNLVKLRFFSKKAPFTWLFRGGMNCFLFILFFFIFVLKKY